MENLTCDRNIPHQMKNIKVMSLALLHRAVNNVNFDGPEGVRFSDGIEWIRGNTSAFLELLRTEGVSLEDFFGAHEGNSYVAGVLLSSELLMAIPRPYRLAFVRMIFLISGPCNHDWLEVVLQCEVTRDELVQVVADKLQLSPHVACDLPERNFWRDDFLLAGAGQMMVDPDGRRSFDTSRTTYWSIFSDEQLFQIMLRVARKAPRYLFGVFETRSGLGLADRLKIRLGNLTTELLVGEAATHLRELSRYVHVEVFDQLPVRLQLQAARRLAAAGQIIPPIWVAKMALQTGSQSASLSLLDELLPRPRCEIGDYLQWCNLLNSRASLDPHIVRRIEQVLQKGLAAAGWAAAYLEEQKRFNRKQLCVTMNGTTYFKTHTQSVYLLGGVPYPPCPGDLVAFRPHDAELLDASGTVQRTGFTLLRRAAPSS